MFSIIDIVSYMVVVIGNVIVKNSFKVKFFVIVVGIFVIGWEFSVSKIIV